MRGPINRGHLRRTETNIIISIIIIIIIIIIIRNMIIIIVHIIIQNLNKQFKERQQMNKAIGKEHEQPGSGAAGAAGQSGDQLGSASSRSSAECHKLLLLIIKVYYDYQLTCN